MATSYLLAELLAEHGHLSLAELGSVFASVLEDLERAHSRGEIHGDVKPSRIRLEADGRYHLSEFGVARIGTPRYMSPERARGDELDARSDLYSLGAVLYEAATGRPPFVADMNSAIIEAQLNQTPEMPSVFRPGLPSRLEKAILRSLAKEPEDRFQTAREFRAALSAAVVRPAAAPRVEPSPAPQPTRPAVAVPPVSRPEPAEAYGAATFRYSGTSPTAAVTPRVAIWRRDIVLLGAAVALAATGALLLLLGVGRKPRVPNAVGMSRTSAERAVKKAGLQAQFVSEVDDTAAAGMVVAQSPLAGTNTAKGGVVQLQTSTGMVRVPDLPATAYADAESQLRVLKLQPVPADSAYVDGVPRGSVAQTAPKAGSRVQPGTRVAVTIALGRATCAGCGARRVPGARFCTECGKPFNE